MLHANCVVTLSSPNAQASIDVILPRPLADSRRLANDLPDNGLYLRPLSVFPVPNPMLQERLRHCTLDDPALPTYLETV